MKRKMELNKREWSDYKRLIELCTASLQYQQDFLKNPKKYLEEHQLRLDSQDAENVVRVWVLKEDLPLSDGYIQYYQKKLGSLYDYIEERTDVNRIQNPAFKAWYQRQVKRNHFQSYYMRHLRGAIYIPVSFEISDGCSVGCPFCCLSAQPLKKTYPCTDENLKEWKDILVSTANLIGGIIDYSICYFATEPLDNPNYEKFLSVFYEVFGAYPQTTTAASDRQIVRTKKLIEMLGEDELKHAVLRFSVTSLEQLEKIYKNFSSEELAYIEVLLNNPESSCGYVNSGRSRLLSKELEDKTFIDETSCVCTNGFVVNLVKKTIKLITPQLPSDKYPMGMEIYEERSFQNSSDYIQVMKDMIEKWMLLEFDENQKLVLADYLTIERMGYRVKIHGNRISRTISMSEQEYYCLQKIVQENYSFAQVVSEQGLTDYEQSCFKKKLMIFYDAGYLQELR